MRRVFGVSAAACVVAAALAGPAGASTTVAWKATFAEHLGGPNFSPFSCPASSFPALCASGEVTGLGQAQDFVEFGACGAGCERRTLTFGDGSTLVFDESESNVAFPGNSLNPQTETSQHDYGHPSSGDLSDTFVGGSGRFSAATAAASGTVSAAGAIATVNLVGTVTF